MLDLGSPLPSLSDQLKKLEPESLYLLTTTKRWEDGEFKVGSTTFATPELRRRFYNTIGRIAIVVNAEDGCHVCTLASDLSISEIY